jgi:ABC-type transport system substrate-binding protein
MSVSKVIFFIIISVLVFGAAGCGSPATPPNANANPNTALKANSGNAANVFNGTTKDPGETTNSAPTVTPLMQAYYDALKKKDEAGLRKFYSAAAIKEMEAGMKTDGKKTLVDYVVSVEPAGDKPFEVRNEKIEGDTAIAEIKGGSYATWVKWKFVKEGGEWKKAPPSEDLKLLGK